jgi:hypothetical protein
MNADLQEFLKGLSRKGVYESTGGFTVDMVKMRMKLRQNQFLHPTHAILSCVRAGVTSGASGIFIGQAYETTRVELREPKELIPRDLIESVLGGGRGAQTEHLLGAAFQGAFASDCQRIEIELPDARVILTAETMNVEPTSSGQTTCKILFRYGGDRESNRRRCVDEARAVSSRAAFCPVPLVLDGIPISEGLGWEKLLEWQQDRDAYGVHRNFVWLEAMLTDVGEPFPMQASQRRFRQEFVGGERFESQSWEPVKGSGFVRVMPKLEGNRRRVRSLTRLGSLLEGPARLYPVKQGVVLEPIEESLGAPAVAIVVRADDLETDLSLFQVVQDDNYRRLVAALQVQTRALIHQFGRSRKSFVLPKQGESGIRQSLAWAVGAAALTAPVGLWGSFVVGLGAWGLATAIHAYRFGDRALVEREQRVRWVIDEYVERVGGAKSGQRRLRL